MKKTNLDAGGLLAIVLVVILAVIGIACLVAPEETLRFFGAGADAAATRSSGTSASRANTSAAIALLGAAAILFLVVLPSMSRDRP